MSTDAAKKIYNELNKIFPDAKCELDFTNLYELLIAVMLSAQATDKRVNIITPDLFKKYPTVFSLAEANLDEVKDIIASLGLYHNKAKNIIGAAQEIVLKHQGEVPNIFDDLIKLPGVGRKTANVVLSVGFNVPAIAVDTHVARVAQRLGLSKSSNVITIEEDLKKAFDQDQWSKAHHLLLLFGRYICTARNPKCSECPFKSCSHNMTK